MKYIIFFLSISSITVAQNIELHNSKTVNYCNSNHLNNSIKEFKDELILKLDINLLKIDKHSEAIEYSHTEKFKNETNLILINDSVGFKVAVARVLDFQVKKYLYKADLFRKHDGCWKPASNSSTWTEFSPGIISSGLGFGYEGNINYLGFNGTIVIE